MSTSALVPDRRPRRAATPPTHHADGTMPERETGTVARVLMILRAVSEDRHEPTMKELADRLNLPLSTMHRLLELLAAESFVERDDLTRAFRPGAELCRMAAQIVHRMPVRALAKPFLAALVQDADESAYLCLLDARASTMTFAARADSSHLLDYRVPMNLPQKLASGASGLSILAWMEKARIDEVLRSELGSPSRQALSAFHARLATIREQGYANTFSQRIQGAVGFFAPVFDGSAQVCGSLGYTVPEVRFQKSRHALLSTAAVKHAAGLSAALGHARQVEAR